MLRCPSCNNKIVRHSGDGKLKIRTRIIAIAPNFTIEIVCSKCGGDVALDLIPGNEIRRQFQVEKKRLVL